MMLTTEQALTKLKQLHANQRLPHALLLIQEHGQDLYPLAKSFAQSLLCHSQTACILFQQQTHPDFRVLGEENQACGIDDIREISHFLSQTAHQQGYKVIIIHSADTLLPQAANALLKTLEEPLGKVVIMILAQKHQRLLDTLKSRCFTLALTSSSDKNHSHQQSTSLQWYLAFAQDQHEHIQKLATKEPQEALYLFYYFISELIRLRLQVKTELSYKQEHSNQLKKVADKVTLQGLFNFLDKASVALKAAITMPGVNKQLLFESLYYPWRECGVNNVFRTTLTSNRR